jgi:hypothetical protein
VKEVKKTIVVTLTVAALSPAVAQAGFVDEMAAAHRVEQKVIRQNPGYNVTAFCDQQGRKFWCSFYGFRHECLLDGKAWVRKHPWRVQIVAKSRLC